MFFAIICTHPDDPCVELYGIITATYVTKAVVKHTVNVVSVDESLVS